MTTKAYGFTIFAIASITLNESAQAYLDPGSASLVVQGIIGGVVAAAATMGFYWQKTKEVVGRLVGWQPVASDARD
jgi:hypothetical protein